MKEYRGSIKKRSDVNWSCLSLLVHFDGPICLEGTCRSRQLIETEVLQTTATKMLSPGTL